MAEALGERSLITQVHTQVLAQPAVNTDGNDCSVQLKIGSVALSNSGRG